MKNNVKLKKDWMERERLESERDQVEIFFEQNHQNKNN